jgi:predicted nucleic acid-binding protein
VSLYLDTSCLLKILFLEPETARTLELIAGEERVIVSSLGKVETLTHLHGRVAAGHLSRAAAKRLAQRLDDMLQTTPYDLMASPVTVYDLASDQLASFPSRGYCRTLDRLHLATMEALRVRRLLTNDDAQARAAEHLGFGVLLPR